MIDLMFEITDEVSFGYFPVQGLREFDKSALLRGTSRINQPTLQRNAMHNVKPDELPLDYSPGLFAVLHYICRHMSHDILICKPHV